MIELYYDLIFYTSFITAGIQLFFIWGIFSRTAFHKQVVNVNSNSEPVSVVISARNEHHNLLHNLKLYLEQDYPDFEVVVVNDQSTDDSEYYLKSLQSTYKNLKVVNVKSPIVFFKGKKFPLSIGIKSATHDILLLTDADCKPNSANWIREMVGPYSEKGVEIVLGYGAYSTKGGLLNYLVRYETMRTAIQFLSFAKAGMPYMGVGRNLSYRKELFYKQHGFQSHYKIQSGDDDLFVNKAASKTNTRIVISTESKTSSAPKVRFIDWINQKRRHLTTGKYYKKSHLFFLGLYDLSFLLFLISTIFLVFSKHEIIIISILFFLRYASYLFILKKSMIKVSEQNLLVISPILEIILAVLMPIISMTNIFYSRNKWK